MGTDDRKLLAGQVRYYRERAPEYDDWWFRRGRHDGGAEANERWFAEIATVEDALEAFAPLGDVLELACGTGLWTRHLARLARTVTAVDASPEVIAINRERVADRSVTYVEADIFAFSPPRRFDACVFTFWLSHVPAHRFEAFWELVDRALAAGGRVFFVDSSGPVGPASHRPEGDEDPDAMLRTLADGRAFRIVKRLYDPASLERDLAALGWAVRVHATPTHFIWGEGRRA